MAPIAWAAAGPLALMFVAGVMNLIWTAVLAVFMRIEKVAPHGDRFGRAVGVLMVVAGSAILGSAAGGAGIG